jgi:hypothetical protein
MAGGDTSAAVIAIAERRLMALELRKQGGSYRQIAEQLRQVEGISDRYNHTQAHDDVAACLTETREKTAETAEDVRQLEYARLDELLSAWWPLAVEKTDYLAFDRVLRIMEQRAKITPGLLAPVKVDQNVSGALGIANFTSDDLAKARQRAEQFEKDLAEQGVGSGRPTE